MTVSVATTVREEVTPMRADDLLCRLRSISEASEKGLKVQNLTRLMSQPELWKLAYVNIHGSPGATTPGVDGNTLDGFSMRRAERLAIQVRTGEYRPRPVRRTYIPKSDGKKRPLGISSGDDKLVQEAVRLLLERVYEPLFVDESHGFRRGRSCHTALAQIKTGWNGTKWIVDVDIKGFFDNIDHDVLLRCIAKRVGDKRLLRLVKSFLEAGYVEDWRYNETHSGIPQGGVISPLLANIYLHELDEFVEGLREVCNVGERRRWNPAYQSIRHQIHKRRKKIDQLKVGHGSDQAIASLRQEVKELLARAREIPTQDPTDPNFKRLRYARYADDFVIGLIGSKEEADHVLTQVKRFLRQELRLEVNEANTTIGRMKDGIEFLGYGIDVYQKDKVRKGIRHGRMTTFRTTSEVVRLRVPAHKLERFCHDKGYGSWSDNKGSTRTNLMRLSVPEIITVYNSEIRGLANYYLLASNMKPGVGRLVFTAHDSMLRTLSAKLKISKMKIIRRLRTDDGEWVWTETAKSGRKYRFKVFKLKHLGKAHSHKDMWELNTRTDPDTILHTAAVSTMLTEMVERLDARKCEACGTEGDCEVHHIRKLKDIRDRKSKSLWDMMQIARGRKTLVLCRKCHKALHGGKLPDRRDKTLMESRVR